MARLYGLLNKSMPNQLVAALIAKHRKS